MECFDDVHTGGGKIESFVSYCGGLPAPEASVKFILKHVIHITVEDSLKKIFLTHTPT